MKVLSAKSEVFKDEEVLIDSHISFGPYVKFLKEKAARKSDARAAYYQQIVNQFEGNPALLGPIAGADDLSAYQEYLDLVVSTIFPVTVDMDKDIYGIGVPHKFAIFYYSDLFRKLFAANGDKLVPVPDGVSVEKVKKDKLEWLYKLILEKVYGFPVDYRNEIIHHITLPDSNGLKKYVKLQIDARFVDVIVKGDLPKLTYDNICRTKFSPESLQEMLPLRNFSLEGFVIWTIQDVTKDEVQNSMKNLILNMHDGNETQTYRRMEEEICSLMQQEDLSVHIVPVPKINGRYVLECEPCESGVMLGVMNNGKQQQQLFQQLLDHLTRQREPLFIPDVTEASLLSFPFLRYLPLKGIRSYIMAPVWHEGQLLGIVELASSTPNRITAETMGRAMPAYPLLIMLLTRGADILNNRIVQVIKEQFTALQPSVEWKFTDAAWHYLHTPKEERKDIGNIAFEDVYPLYGAVDIRNSSTERSNAIHEDLREQLLLIGETLEHIGNAIYLPLLEELKFKNDELITGVTSGMLSEDELKTNNYLDEEIGPLFRHLHESHPELQPVLERYFSMVDDSEGHILHHRQEYEDSLAAINAEINKYLDKEKDNIQHSFPCYFEKYRTDGVEYNIYIGQSIAQNRKFDLLYLRNLRLWQLSSMAEIARMTNKLKDTLKVPLQTTQLILAHSNPIDISFRQDERRFDVEGAYNIRYEIIKKRIDKVHIRQTGKRLTQPGTISIVYAYAREMEEYLKYITFLQNKGVLLPDVEVLDLEDLQGVSGLRALRVKVNMN
ncbi:GAF domain-containing protein [Chitinophaga rhizophila]|uniref:GAF domain-containing protein n=1 Tax=Chitinophaga rhizophila TaxID=2866212 RepID=A0ABS7GLN0_9BACT|nr:GAF domain-containing protein [Chitinophaga rhizophila]MBW8688386.1 GAF domain-containing protein [Chitinophaga rhizophila]